MNDHDSEQLAEAIHSITSSAMGSHAGIIRALNILSSYVVQSDARIAALEAAASGASPAKVGTWDADGQHWQCDCTTRAAGWGPAWVECAMCHVRRPPFAFVVRDEQAERSEAQHAAQGTCAHGLSTPCADCGYCCGRHDAAVPHRMNVAPPPHGPVRDRMPPKHSLRFIINGEECTQPVTPGMPVSAARNSILEATGNTGRPPDEWEVREESGVLVQGDVMAVSFPHGTRLFCTIRVGAGGDADLHAMRAAAEKVKDTVGPWCLTSADDFTRELTPKRVIGLIENLLAVGADNRYLRRVLALPETYPHGAERAATALNKGVRAHDAEGTQYGRERGPR